MSRRTLSGAVAGLVAASLLGACSTPLPVPEPDAVPAALPPAVSPAQVEDILAEVAAVLEEADAERDGDLLAARVTGPALDMRTVEYAAAEAGDEDAVTAIPTGAQTVIVPSTDSWPRTVMIVTEAPEDLQAPLLATFVQDEPREQFRLWSWVRLFPGAQMPTTNQPELGSEVVADDDLLMPPEAVIEAYVDLLGQGEESEHADVFTDDPLRQGIADTRQGYAALVEEQGSLAETYQAGDSGVRTIGTADGGAIVVGTIQIVTTITLDDSTLTIGEETLTESLAITWGSMVAFAVPPAGSDDPIRVLGAEHLQTEVTGE